MKNVDFCENVINEITIETTDKPKLFRPPYGKLKRKQKN